MTRFRNIHFLWAFSLFLLTWIFSPAAQAQSSLPKFTCDGYPYQVLSGELKKFDTVTMSYVSQGPTTSPGINGIGYNILDNYAYGMSGSNIYRLGSNGTREKVSSGIAGAVSFSADMNTSGKLISPQRTNRKNLIVMDIPASIAAASGNTVSSVLNFTGVTPPGSGDIAWATDGGVDYILLIRNNRIYYYNLSTLVITSKTLVMPAGVTSINFGAAWTDRGKRVWGFNNGSGKIYEVLDPFLAAPELVEVAALTPNGSNDGFSCSQANFPTLPPVALDDDFTTTVETAISENVIVDNGNGVDSDPDGSAISVLWADPGTTAPANGTISGTNANGNFTYTPDSGFYGTDSFEYVLSDGGETDIGLVTISIPVDNSDAPAAYGNALHNVTTKLLIGADITLDTASQSSANSDADTDDGVTLPVFIQGAPVNIVVDIVQGSAKEGYLQAWVDWDSNDNFSDSGDQIAIDLQSVNSGADTISVTINVPADAATGQTTLRVRWSSMMALDSDATAPDGEVEDYAITILTPAKLDAKKSVSVWDPLDIGLYALPGNDVIYTIKSKNVGEGPADNDSIDLIDHIPGEVTFYNGDIDDGGPETHPVEFTQTTGAGLTFNYATDVGYSDSATRPSNFGSCDYSPTSGYDANVKYICFNPKGSFVGGSPNPAFSVSFRSRIN